MKLLQWFAPVELTRFVDEGRVGCPMRRRDVDVETCLDCAFLARTVQEPDGTHSKVVCTPTLALTFRA